LWIVGRGAHRVAAGKVAVRAGGVLPDAVSQPADPVRQTAAQAAVPAHGQLASHRAAVLRPTGGQDAHRDAHPGHAAQRQQLQLAVHKLHVTLRLEADDGHARPVVMPRPPLVLTLSRSLSLSGIKKYIYINITTDIVHAHILLLFINIL